jgi:hypothetical protein
MSMLKYRPVALAAVCALALAAPASAAYAATAHHAAKPVLTIRKKGGPAVRTRAVLEASLAKGKSVVFTIVLGSSSVTASCKSSTLHAKVTANRGKATLSLTGLTLRRCTAPDGISLSVKALNLPYHVTISSAKGFPVTIAGRSKAKPLSLQAKVSFGMTTDTCVGITRQAHGHASNSGNKVSVKQKFTLDKGNSSAGCAQLGVTAVTYSATYGPLRDRSVRHSPKVFFN